MSNEVIESLVSKIIQSYKYVGFINDTIHERDLFLSFLTFTLVKTENSKGAVSLSEALDKDLDFHEACKSFAKKADITPALLNFLNELSKLLVDNANTHGKLVLKEILQLSADFTVKSLTVEERISVYDRVLQRLQAMNTPDQLSSDFSYQTLPFNFAELYTKLLSPSKGQHAYDPYAMTGESIVDFALLNKGVSITTESVNQSSRYIQHKLLIAGASSINTENSFALASKPNIRQAEFDLAFTLLQPNISSEIEEATVGDTKKLKGEFEHNRIPKTVVKSRFWEQALIHHMLYSLNDSGKAVIITGKGPLSRHSDYHSRKLLIDNNQIDGIIQLPTKLLDARTVPLFAIVLNKKRSNTNKVKFIDAHDNFISENGINKLTRLDDIAEAFHSSTSKSVTNVSTDSIIENGYSLNVESYLSREVQPFEYIDVEEVQQALTKQQRITDLIVKKLDRVFSNS
jgi:hypothetical protein